MNIELQKTGELTATVKIDLSPADYEEKVLKVLKDYQRKAQMPGFRPGKVPFGLTKKMYGQAVTADEINKLLGESLDSFIREQNLDLLGNPLANTEKTPQIDFSEPAEMSFYFDLGLSPQFELKLDGKSGVIYHRIEVSDEIARKYMDDLRRRNGTLTDVEVSEKGDMLKGDFAELDTDGTLKPEGITSSGSVNPELFKDEAIQALFAGVKTGDVVKFNPMQASGNATDVAAMLGISKEQAETLNAEFNFTVTGISRMIPAEMNAEFFEKIYPGIEIADEAALLEQIKKDAAGSFVGESDKKFFNDAIKYLIESSAIELPDEFLKRWLVDVNQDKLSAEEVEKNYDDYARSMRWQLIENRLIREHNIQVSEEEIRDVFRNYFQRPGSAEMDEDMKMRIDGIVDSFMKNKEDVRRINDQLFEQKILAFLKENIQSKEQTISYEDFAKLQ
ncbi:trigger factor [Lentimicrobium sp.]|jgi:trigger factor|uniref:trigger factor n=1 Tax=Lentimicrobium sp. TaxID=2034841 RepID=UPI0025EAE416|nr:trigger factor [Lentimicrobium sp.]MCO5257709.1 trigger factor [Lentimicrobium sp.]MCO5261685.1 trigger factor [Lentimicrobium sp.]HPF64024.1 trigger factor [Lentimicrobium sp.]HPR26267.1 trigger factor [Lentimicrobium sp.]HRW69190.1 trigger factor [Lentimicrobium sp.]